MALKTERRETVEVDGVEVQVPVKRRGLINTGDTSIKFARTEGLSGRQNLESQAKRIGRGVWDYITGEGDDIERLKNLIPDDESDD